MKKIIFIVLCSFLTCHLIAAENQVDPTLKNNTKQETLSLLGEITLCKPSNPVFLLVISHFIKLFLHEWGHGLARIAMDNFNLNALDGVHFFCSMKDWSTHPPLLNLGKLKIHGNGILAVCNAKTFDEKYKNFFALLAGPATGLIVCNTALYVINQYSKNRDNNETLKQKIESFCSPFQIILNSKKLSFEQKRFVLNLSFIVLFFLIEEAFYGFMPNTYGLAGLVQDSGGHAKGDGRRLWEDFFCADQTLIKTISIGAGILEWSLYAYLIVKYSQALKNLSLQNQSQIEA